MTGSGKQPIHDKKDCTMKKNKFKSDILPILIGVLFVGALVGAVLFFANQSKEPAAIERVHAADDGELADYESDNTITLGDYNNLSSLATKEDLSEKNTDDPKVFLWDSYLETCKIKSYPKDMLDAAIIDQQVQMQGFAKASGMTVEELAESYGMDDSSIEEAAKDDVKGRLVAKTIALKENIKLTDDIYLKKLVEMMESDEKNPDLNTLEKDYIDTTSVRPKDDAYVQLIKDFLMEKWTASN